jgi:hypothetical protein
MIFKKLLCCVVGRIQGRKKEGRQKFSLLKMEFNPYEMDSNIMETEMETPDVISQLLESFTLCKGSKSLSTVEKQGIWFLHFCNDEEGIQYCLEDVKRMVGLNLVIVGNNEFRVCPTVITFYGLGDLISTVQQKLDIKEMPFCLVCQNSKVIYSGPSHCQERRLDWIRHVQTPELLIDSNQYQSIIELQSEQTLHSKLQRLVLEPTVQASFVIPEFKKECDSYYLFWKKSLRPHLPFLSSLSSMNVVVVQVDVGYDHDHILEYVNESDLENILVLNDLDGWCIEIMEGFRNEFHMGNDPLWFCIATKDKVFICNARFLK